MSTANNFYDERNNVSDFDIDNSGSILPTIRRFSNTSMNKNSPKKRVMSHSPVKSSFAISKPINLSSSIIQQFKNVSLRDSRLVVYK